MGLALRDVATLLLRRRFRHGVLGHRLRERYTSNRPMNKAHYTTSIIPLKRSPA